ncbi:MAG: rRNA maturation RNase YbeY [Candidatus Angelobacter sp.]
MVILEKELDGVVPAALNRFVRRAQALAEVSGEVDVLITGNRRVQELNRRFRRKNKPTDVLSFPRMEGGDIAISVDIALENARRYGHEVAEEVKILILHGMLHLAGYDHESDNGRMAEAEARMRGRLKLPMALIDRTHSKAGITEKSTVRSRRSRNAERVKPTARRRSRP